MDTSLLTLVGFWVDVLGGLCLLALGVAVAMLRPRRPVHLAFAAYAAAVGVAIVGANALAVAEKPFLLLCWFIGWIAVAGVFQFWVGFQLNATLDTGRRLRAWPLAVACCLPWVADRVLVRVMFGWPLGGYAPDDLLLAEAIEGGAALAYASVFFIILLVALRTRSGAWTMPPRVASLLSIGLVALPAFDQAVIATDAIDNGAWQDVLLQSLRAAVFLVCGVAWLAAAPRVGRPAVVAGLACFAFTALGVVLGAAATDSALDGFVKQGSYGVVSLIAAAFLAYAIVRHQLFDIDIKVKWTLTRGSVAAIFLGVFVVVAQLAQNFLADRYGWALGGVAAGVLLFAVAPIKRAAQRMADRAMPGVRPDDPHYVLSRKRETYRNAFATAWADGTLTAKDQRMLQQVREALGLPEKDIVAIEKAWAADP